MTQSDAERLKVLEQLESGDLNFDQALNELQRPSSARPTDGASSTAESRRWRYWWLLPLYFGVLAMGLGIVAAYQGGWGWLLAAPLLMGGAVSTIVALASTRSPWLHVRITNPSRSWPKTIGISIPVPMRFAAWSVRTIGPLIPNLDEHAIAEMLMAFELGRMMDEPLHVEIDDSDSGNRVEIYLG
ncbi:MAG: hypothetical protein BMS9Abin28_0829 [Anaerolineae bacterium]|nr:MAG: hypothetical protein BMS9Abin28_0829 [Anaerolineae bacterium]